MERDTHPGAARRPSPSSRWRRSGSPMRSSARPRHVTVPAGARAGQLTLHSCHYRRLRRADCGTLVVPENRARPALAADRAAGHAHPRAARPIRHAGVPPRGRPGPDEHRLPARRAGSSPPRRRARRLPRRRRARRGWTARRSPRRSRTRPTCSRPRPAAPTRRPRRRARGACRARASTSAATRCRSASRTSRPPAPALGYPRIDLLSESAGTRTALIYAWRHPREHRALGDGRRQPARPLPLGPGHDRRADRPLRPAVRGRPRLPLAHDDLEATMRTADPAPLGPVPDRVRQRAAGHVLRADGVDPARPTPLASPTTFDTWLAGAGGDPSGFWFQSLMARLTLPASRCVGRRRRRRRRPTARRVERHFAGRRPSILGDPARAFCGAAARC